MMEPSNLDKAYRPTPEVSCDPYYKPKQMVPADSPDTPHQGPLREAWFSEANRERLLEEVAFKAS